MSRILSLTCLGLALFAPIASAQSPRDITRPVGAYQMPERVDLEVPAGHTVPFITRMRFNKVVVADDTRIDVTPVSDTQILLRGKEEGRTNILLYDNGTLIDVIAVEVGMDLGGIKADLKALFPEQDITLRRVANKIFVSGEVDDSFMSDTILAIVESHASEGVINALKVKSPRQVALKVRFLEASRETVKQLGFGSLLERAGDFSFLTTPSIISGEAPNTSGTLFGSSGAMTLDLTLKALEEKGIIRTLAEPNLVASSGSKASFLAGGEFPIPVAAEDNRVTIEFREFGVSLDFEPEVTGKDKVNLHVLPEVSQVDSRNAIRVSGFEIPALIVRRADTAVELRHGQTFAIAGLLQNAYDNDVMQTPLVGDLPVLGSLFRSTRFRERETELIILVTPMLLNTADAPEAKGEIENVVVNKPSQGELFLLGQVDGRILATES